MQMCCQIARALQHLDGLGLRHDDVAARNCVVSSHLLVKLSVIGLTKDGFEKYEERFLLLLLCPVLCVFRSYSFL